jgi:hypothetical protein
MAKKRARLMATVSWRWKIARVPVRRDFAVLSHKVAQSVDVFVVNFFNTSHREAAKALAAKQWVLGLALWALVFVIKT